jgi:hypothetical protein
MSFYEIACGVNSTAGIFLRVIDLAPDMVPRIRDVWTDENLETVTVYARIGGGNREGYQEQINILRCHKYYINDEDCEFDRTYAKFTFSIPLEQKEEILKVISGHAEDDLKKLYAVMTKTSTQKWGELNKAMEKNNG